MFVRNIFYMKKTSVSILFLIISILLLSSCKKDDESPANDPRAENLKALGVSAEDLLSADKYDKLTVEFVYPNGFRPNEATIDAFRALLAARINKPAGINIFETVITPPQNAPFTTAEIKEIEAQNRTKYTQGNTIAVYVFFANGNASTDTDTSVTLGTAYQNTSIVVYEHTLQVLAENTQNYTENLVFLETNTIEHEFGHILGLVNIQGDDIHPTGHEDPAHSKHCVVESCLMYFESNNPLRIMERMQTRSEVPQFDSLCIADLQAKGGL